MPFEKRLDELPDEDCVGCIEVRPMRPIRETVALTKAQTAESDA